MTDSPNHGTSGDQPDVTATGGPGIGACKGPVTCLGYYDDPDGNAIELFRARR